MNMRPLPTERLKEHTAVSPSSVESLLQCTWSAVLDVPSEIRLMKRIPAILGEAAHAAINEWTRGIAGNDLTPAQHLRSVLDAREAHFRSEGFQQSELRIMPLLGQIRDLEKFHQATALIAETRDRIAFGNQPIKKKGGFRLSCGSDSSLRRA
ncbi:MAG: hypothetical protein H0U72_13265 [Nitrosospira sp.]|nr:hypothetical protein [Nitrosospira sp.]